MEETILPYQNPQSKKSKISGTVWVAISAIAVILIGGFVLSRQQKKEPEVNKDIVVEKKEPTPTEKPKIEKSTVKIQVLNGTGTPGQAGVAVKALEEAGYNIENIKSSNAEKYDQETTTITLRAHFEDIADDIKDALKSKFDVISVASKNLEENSEFDIVVITGGDIFEDTTATPSATVTPSSVSPTVSPTPTP